MSTNILRVFQAGQHRNTCSEPRDDQVVVENGKAFSCGSGPTPKLEWVSENLHLVSLAGRKPVWVSFFFKDKPPLRFAYAKAGLGQILSCSNTSGFWPRSGHGRLLHRELPGGAVLGLRAADAVPAPVAGCLDGLLRGVWDLGLDLLLERHGFNGNSVELGSRVFFGVVVGSLFFCFAA